MTIKALEEFKSLEDYKVENAEKYSDPELRKLLSTIFGITDVDGKIKKLRSKELWLLADGPAKNPVGNLPPRKLQPVAFSPAPKGNVAVPRQAENTVKKTPAEMKEIQRKSEDASNNPRNMGTGIEYEKETTSYTGNLRGEPVELKDVEVREIQYTKRPDADREQLRKEFQSTERKKFLQDTANDPAKVAELKKAGLTDAHIADMQDGDVPNGYQVHHKLPLDDGGTNAQNNFVLIKNEPYHKTITNVQSSQTRGMVAGETKTVQLPIPPSYVYPK
jgi:hypothetical protein